MLASIWIVKFVYKKAISNIYVCIQTNKLWGEMKCYNKTWFSS